MSASWGLGGVLGAGLALVALQVVVSSDTAATGAAGLLQLPGKFAQSWTDPTVPLISGAGSSGSSGSSGKAAPFGAAGIGQALLGVNLGGSTGTGQKPGTTTAGGRGSG